MGFNRFRRAAVIAAFAMAVGVGHQAFSNEAPVIGSLAPVSGEIGAQIEVSCPCTDDGLPTPPTLTYQWSRTAGAGSSTFADATAATTTWSTNTPGAHTLQCVCCDRGAAASCTGRSDADTLTATATFVGVLDEMVAASGLSIPELVMSAPMIWRRVYSGGPASLIRVRRSDNAAETDIGDVAGALDEAAISAFCAGTTCTVPTVYDGSGQGRDFTQTTVANQPTIYTSGAVVKRGSLPCALHTAGSPGDYWTRSDLMGMSATNPGTAIFAVVKNSSLAAERVVAMLGGSGGSQAYQAGFLSSGTAVVSNNTFTPTDYQRAFTLASSSTAAFHHYLFSQPKRVYTPGATVRQDGALLTEASVFASGVQPALLNTISSLGAGAAGIRGFDGHFSGAIFFYTPPQGAELAALNDFGNDAVEAAEGARPGAADISKLARVIGVTGQSNGAYLSVPTADPTPRYGDYWFRRAVPGTSVVNGTWTPPSGAQYLELLAELALLDPRIDIVLWWVQGENEAAAGQGAQYQAAMTALDNALIANGYTVRWLDTLLYTTGMGAHTAVVNAAKVSWGATIPTRWRAIDAEGKGSLDETTHWDAAMRTVMINLAVTTINTEYPLTYPRRKQPPKRDASRTGGNVVTLASRRRQREERELVEQVKRAA